MVIQRLRALCQRSQTVEGYDLIRSAELIAMTAYGAGQPLCGFEAQCGWHHLEVHDSTLLHLTPRQMACNPRVTQRHINIIYTVRDTKTVFCFFKTAAKFGIL